MKGRKQHHFVVVEVEVFEGRKIGYFQESYVLNDIDSELESMKGSERYFRDFLDLVGAELYDFEARSIPIGH